MAINVGKKQTFTLVKLPHRAAQRKTLERLMRMQPSVQNRLKRQHQARKGLNRTYIRAGRDWTARVRATKMVTLEKGGKFTIVVTPHILPDLKSVEQFLQSA